MLDFDCLLRFAFLDKMVKMNFVKEGREMRVNIDGGCDGFVAQYDCYDCYDCYVYMAVELLGIVPSTPLYYVDLKKRHNSLEKQTSTTPRHYLVSSGNLYHLLT